MAWTAIDPLSARTLLRCRRDAVAIELLSAHTVLGFKEIVCKRFIISIGCISKPPLALVRVRLCIGTEFIVLLIPLVMVTNIEQSAWIPI